MGLTQGCKKLAYNRSSWNPGGSQWISRGDLMLAVVGGLFHDLGKVMTLGTPEPGACPASTAMSTTPYRCWVFICTGCVSIGKKAPGHWSTCFSTWQSPGTAAVTPDLLARRWPRMPIDRAWRCVAGAVWWTSGASSMPSWTKTAMTSLAECEDNGSVAGHKILAIDQTGVSMWIQRQTRAVSSPGCN